MTRYTNGARRCIKIGAFGTVIAALCCFTPILVILLSFFGFGTLTGYLDFLLIPALGVFIVILTIGLWRLRHET